MRKALLWTAATLLLLPVLLVTALLLALNIDPGRTYAAALIASLTGNTVKLQGLSGRFPDRLRLAHLEVADRQGPWLLLDDVALDWSPTALLHRRALVHTLQAARLQLPRLPRSDPAPPSTQPFALPLRITVESLAIPRIELGQPVLGTQATLALTGKADATTLDDATAELTLLPLPPAGEGRGEGPGPKQNAYRLKATLTPQTIEAALQLDDPANGLLSRVAGLPDIGPIHLDATATGSRTALATTLALTAGPLTADATATIDLPGARATIDARATAPAMTPAPGIAWRAVALDAHIAGPFTAPDATGHLRIDAPQIAGATLAALTADLAGNAGQATIRATLDTLKLPGPSPDLLAASPIQLTATARLDDPARPVRFTLAHPLLAAEGNATTAADPTATITLRLPDLAPLAAIAGLTATGDTTLTLETRTTPTATTIESNGTLALRTAPGPAAALIGPAARLALAARLEGQSITLSRLTLDGAALSLAASGTSTPAGLDVTAKATLSNLALVAPTIEGATILDAHVTGPPSNLTVAATLAGDVAAPGYPRAPIRLQADLTGLPAAPTGRVTAEGAYAGAPIHLALTANRNEQGVLATTIDRADWRSLHAEGSATLAAGATLPTGRVALGIAKLDDLRSVIGQPLAGALTATAAFDPVAITLDADLRQLALAANRINHATLKARATSPLDTPTLAATITADGIDISGTTGTARLEVAGPQSALALKTTATLTNAGTAAQIAATALLDAVTSQLRLATAQATVQNAALKPETIRLLAPATIRYAPTVTVDHLRLGVRQATLDVAGRLAPTIDATIALRTPADLAAILDPAYAADGSITLDAKLTGPAAQPAGTIRLAATGIRMRTGPGRAIPPANLDVTAQLAGPSARLAARLTAGSAQLAINGQAPIGPGPLNLAATGALDLALLDPILNAAGRRARGRLALDATITGPATAPRLAGTAQLSGGEIQDFAQGVRITDLAATIRADGDTVRIASLTGRAGPGTIAASGSIGALAPGMPVDLAITLRNARPLASDQVTADLDADLTLKGQLQSALQAAGRVTIRRAELRVPKTLPASVVTLNVRRPGDKAPVPAAPSLPIALDLAIEAPNAVYLRGRGIDAEMQGSLRIRGTSTQPQVGGGLQMRRGSISVAGTTLNFSRGKVGFDGTGVTGKIDPTLDFAADSTAGGVTATLAITGYVSKPKITLSSVPDLPQDEVLAYLIFKRSAKELGPFQIAEIAAALAELTGVGGDGGLNPLESVRKGLGLDRLSVGAGSGTSTTPTIEAGRYVANGVYVGAKQGTTGGQTQATVQIDITKGLKLQTDVGTGQGGNQVGLTYQFEY